MQLEYKITQPLWKTIPQNVKLSYDMTQQFYSKHTAKKNENISTKKSYTLMFVAALLIVAQK